MSIIGIGVDIIYVQRIKNLINKFGDKFVKKILSKKELYEFLQCKKKEFFVAKKFSVKESIVKALGTGFNKNINFKNFEITHDNLGKPKIKFLNYSKSIYYKLKIKSIHVSITDEKKYVCTVVILEK